MFHYRINRGAADFQNCKNNKQMIQYLKIIKIQNNIGVFAFYWLNNRCEALGYLLSLTTTPIIDYLIICYSTLYIIFKYTRQHIIIVSQLYKVLQYTSFHSLPIHRPVLISKKDHLFGKIYITKIYKYFLLQIATPFCL